MEVPSMSRLGLSTDGKTITRDYVRKGDEPQTGHEVFEKQ
jgi:hypothetical protein